MGPQIWHQGMSRKPGTGHFPDAPSDGPSGITLTGKKIADEPTEADVIDMAQAYADAAADAKRLGFDCHRAARRPRLPDRRVLLGRHQPAHRPLRRRHHRTALRIRCRSHPPLPRRHRRHADDHPRLAVEVGRLQRQARHQPERARRLGRASSSTPASTRSTARSVASWNPNSPRSTARTASTSRAGSRSSPASPPSASAPSACRRNSPPPSAAKAPLPASSTKPSNASTVANSTSSPSAAPCCRIRNGR